MFHTKPKLKKILLRLNNADIEKIGAGVHPHVPNGKHGNLDTGYYVCQRDRERLPSPSEPQARGFTKAQLVFQERVLLA